MYIVPIIGSVNHISYCAHAKITLIKSLSCTGTVDAMSYTIIHVCTWIMRVLFIVSRYTKILFLAVYFPINTYLWIYSIYNFLLMVCHYIDVIYTYKTYIGYTIWIHMDHFHQSTPIKQGTMYGISTCVWLEIPISHHLQMCT